MQDHPCRLTPLYDNDVDAKFWPRCTPEDIALGVTSARTRGNCPLLSPP